MSENKLRKFYILTITAFLPLISFAEGTVTLFGKTICKNDPCKLSDAMFAIGGFIQYLSGLAIIIAIIAVAYSGLKIVMSAGKSGKVEEAKKDIENALWGVFVALASYLIIKAIVTGLGGTMLPS